MNILALEASGAEAGIAAVQNETDAPLAVLGTREPKQLSRAIITGLSHTMERAGWTLDDVEAIAVGLGPGSWTSLRIALSTCKTLAQARNLLLVGVPTFDALARSVWQSQRLQHAPHFYHQNGSIKEDSTPLPEDFVLLVSARSRPGELYGKIYQCRLDGVEMLQAECVAAPEELLDAARAQMTARRIAEPLVLVGNGAEDLSEALTEIGESHLALSVPIEVSATEIGRAAAVLIASGHSANPLDLQPLYIALSAPERLAAQRATQSSG
jgi:tRNA threonylcarbamoyladenosine biosynthesis protein TsaB